MKNILIIIALFLFSSCFEVSIANSFSLDISYSNILPIDKNKKQRKRSKKKFKSQVDTTLLLITILLGSIGILSIIAFTFSFANSILWLIILSLVFFAIWFTINLLFLPLVFSNNITAKAKGITQIATINSIISSGILSTFNQLIDISVL